MGFLLCLKKGISSSFFSTASPNLLQNISLCLKTKLLTAFLQDVTDIRSRLGLDYGSSKSRVDDYDVRSHAVCTAGVVLDLPKSSGRKGIIWGIVDYSE